MKRFLALVCMITCIFGLTACGSEEAKLTEFEQAKVEFAKERAVNDVIPLLIEFTKPENYGRRTQMNAYTIEEVEYVLLNTKKFEFDGYAFLTGMESFDSALKATGDIVSVGDVGTATAEIDGKQIIVHVPIDGENKDAEAEVIFSNDMFLKMESVALNPISTMGDLMERAALNTLIGMGTVFIVLILISLIISCFAFIPKIQAKLSKKEDNTKTAGVDNALARIVTQEETGTDDLELVAVIAAAIAASEGAASTDGFVVRSIRKRK